MKIGFVTDSTADLPVEMACEHAIEVVPAVINISGHSYYDGIDLSREQFYYHLPEMKPPPTTSSPSVGSFEERYGKILGNGAEIVLSIHPPEKLTGIINSARLAAQAFGGRVRIIDSGQLSLGLGFQVILAAEAVARGAILDEVIMLLSNLRQRVRVAALLNGIEYVRRSGRVSWAMARLGGLLHLRPLIELRYGIVHRLGQARTRMQGVQRLIEELNSWGALERLAVLHTNAETAARNLLEEIKAKVPVQPLLVNVTTAIGTHVGPDGLGFAAISMDS